MALTKISGNEIQPASITADLISANVSFGVKISNVSISNSTYSILDDTAVNVGGGYIVVTGSDFQSGAVVLVDTTQATSTTYVNSTTLRVQLPAKSAATYNIYVVNPDGGVGIKLNGVNYSATPTWVTASPLANVQANQAFTGSFSATGATSYSVADGSSLPSGMTLVGANGYYYGTITVGSDTTYSFTINATDAENQDSPATFNLTAISLILDSYFNSTVLLLQGDGTNGAQNQTFVDSSTNNLTITRNGNATQGSFSPFSPTGWSAYFDGTGDYLTVADNAALDVDGGDFTMEAWVYMNVNNGSAVNTIFAKGFGSAGGWMLWIQGAIRLRMYDTGGTQFNLVGSTTPAAGRWHHIAATRSGNTLTIYLNGVLEGTLSYTSTNTNAATFEIGGYNAGTAVYAGYISNARLVKGSVVYASNFTPATEPLTAVSGTSLLTCQSNRFVDKSTNNFTITRNGDTKVVSFSPFAPTTAYSTSTHGGSMFMDGVSDALTLTSTTGGLGSGDFTLEFWWYPETTSAGDGIIFNSRTGGGSDGIDIYGLIKATTSGTVLFDNSSKVNYFAWNHVAFTRSGSTFYRFINGEADGSRSFTNNLSGVGFTIGNGPIGKIAGFKHVRGTALYTSAFSIPTQPPTATSGTELLLNFTNAGIYDATAKNVLETVGNAQVSTAVKKYGTGSMYFDGSSYVTSRPDALLDLGSGDFTVEFWLNAVSWGSGTGGVVGKKVNDGTNGWQIYRNSTNASKMSARLGGTNDFYTTSSITTGTWAHWALVRTGTTLYWFKDGVLDATGSSSLNLVDTSANFRIAFADMWSAYANFYMDDLRITKGIARYTSNFTPPTAALPVQ